MYTRNNNEEDFKSYEDARIDKGRTENPKEATDEEVNEAVIIVNPDGNTMDRG